MALGTLTISGTASEQILAADINRDHVVIQLQSAHVTYFGFGETAVTLQGASLIAAGHSLIATGHKARGVINVINADSAAVLGYETQEGLILNTNS